MAAGSGFFRIFAGNQPETAMSERLPDLKTASRERIGWIDLLRVLACFLVVFSHCCALFVGISNLSSTVYGIICYRVSKF